jgi:hypothetical protein
MSSSRLIVDQHSEKFKLHVIDEGVVKNEFFELQGRCVGFFIAMKGINDSFLFLLFWSQLATLTSLNKTRMEWYGILFRRLF